MSDDPTPKDPLAEFYRQLDSELSARGHTCKACGQCCHFDRADHVLYASALERAHLASAHLPDNPDAHPELLARGERCPFQVEGLCTAGKRRTLGCRLHFCDQCLPKGERDQAEALAEIWHAKLKKLHEQKGVEWDYRRLLPLEPKNRDHE